MPVWAVLGLARQGPCRLATQSMLDVCVGPRLGASRAPLCTWQGSLDWWYSINH